MAEETRQSGIAWIGKIPQSWNVKRLKYICEKITDGSHFSPETVDEGYTYITVADVYNGVIHTENAKQISVEDYRQLVKNGCQPETGDVLLSKDGTVGRSAIVLDTPNYVVLSSLGILSPSNLVDSRYLKYCIDSNHLQEQMTCAMDGSALKRITISKISEFYSILPSVLEQVAIANFLDTECARIDSIIADLEKQIETLKQYKKSLITETVTKGLDKSVPMKDSGIEWIGNIPKHWNTNRLRYVASVKTGPFGTQLSADEYVDEGVPIINVKNIGYGSILAEDLDFVPESVADRLSVHRLKNDDIVFGRKGAVDKHAIITEEYVDWVQGSDCIRVRSNAEIDSGYLNYLFDSSYFGSYVMLYAVGSTMPSMSSDILLNARILVPPVKEQRDITSYLDAQCGKINGVIANKQMQLDTIRQHRKSLIYEYVTGKKRIKEVQ